MQSSELKRLAEQFMLNAIKAVAGDNVWIETQGPETHGLRDACVDVLNSIGAKPHVVDVGSDKLNTFLTAISDDDLTAYGREQLAIMQTMQGYIRIRDDEDLGKIPSTQLSRFQKARHAMTEHRIDKTRWLIVSTPTAAFAEACGKSHKEFEDFYLGVCLLDYQRMGTAAAVLQDVMAKGQSVHIIGRDTDLKFSIAGLGAMACTGTVNIPDGECFTAPVKDSINGHIAFGPSNYMGERFTAINLVFKDGKIVESTAATPAETEALNRILDTDAGSRFTGEFAIAFNPLVKEPMGDILFDEKIDGSLHIAMGQAYKVADNGNTSSVHWDMVHIQRPDHGGGEIWIDGRLIRKDGRFIVPELLPLNPENLLGDAKPVSMS